MDTWTTIRFLKANGMKIKKIAREVGVARNTVRSALKSTGPPKYQRRPRDNPDLLPFREDILVMLTQGFIGTRILSEIRKKGYQASQAAFYRYLKKLKGNEWRKKVSERYETSPGQQAQFDWSPYTVRIGGVLRKVIVFSMILGYSRRKHYLPSLDETQDSIFEAIESGFQHFGGVTKELLIDNAKAMVLECRSPRTWNPRFLELCGHYRFKPVACRPRRAKTKGKVEKPFFYLEQHFIKGREFRDFNHFSCELRRFEEGLDVTVHSTTQEKPLDRFEREQADLTPLPGVRFISTKETFRKVSWDCLISFGGSRYSVPYQYAGKNVWVRRSQGMLLRVFSQKGELLCTHALTDKKGSTILVKEHYEGLRKLPPATKSMVEERFNELFPNCETFLGRLQAQKGFNSTHHLREIISLLASYSKKWIMEAFGLAIEYNTFSCSFIRGLLEKKGAIVETSCGLVSHCHIPVLKIKRDLGYYQRFIADSSQKKGGEIEGSRDESLEGAAYESPAQARV